MNGEISTRFGGGMCDAKTWVNSAGLVLTILGVYIIYKNSPINIDETDGGYFSDNPQDDLEKQKQNEDKTRNANRRMTYGTYFVIAGSVLQLVSNFMVSGA